MSNAQKTPLSRTLSLYVDQMIRKALDRSGKALPASVVSVQGSIVTVKFEVQGVVLPQVQMPLFGPEYIRYPIQVGDKGYCLPGDLYLGAMSGLGTGTADTTPRGNLSTLVFFPIGNKNWTATDDANAVVIYGPDGVILRDTNGHSKVTLTPSGIDIHGQHNVTLEGDTDIKATVGSNSIEITTSQIVLKVGGATLTLTASGLTSSVPITAPDATLGGKDFLTHTHDVVGVQTGASTVVTTPPL